MDSYLSIAEIAENKFMNDRMNAAVAQQKHLGNIDLGRYGSNPYNITQWVVDNRYTWASSPGWGAAWAYAIETHAADEGYEPGKDEAVITDDMILATVQALGNPEE